MAGGITLVKPGQRRVPARCGEGLPQQSASRLEENPGLGTPWRGDIPPQHLPGSLALDTEVPAGWTFLSWMPSRWVWTSRFCISV